MTADVQLFCEVFAAYGLDAAVAAIARRRERPAVRYARELRSVCRSRGITARQLLGLDGRHLGDAASTRRIAMAVLREARASLPEIGAALGCHHTTVMAGLRRIKKLDLELAEARAISSRLVDGKRKAA